MRRHEADAMSWSFRQYDNEDGDDGKPVVSESPSDRVRFIVFGMVLAFIFAAGIVAVLKLRP